MQCEKPNANEWGKPNLMCIMKKKTFEAKQKKGMTRQANNQIPIHGPMQNLKHA
jgi:hypothetical protein